MAKIHIQDPEKLGAIIRKHGREEGGLKRKDFVDGAAALIAGAVSMPAGHKIRVRSDDDDDTTWMILPPATDIAPALASIGGGTMKVPSYYATIVALSSSANVDDRMRAYDMRMADYLMSRFL